MDLQTNQNELIDVVCFEISRVTSGIIVLLEWDLSNLNVLRQENMKQSFQNYFLMVFVSITQEKEIWKI